MRKYLLYYLCVCLFIGFFALSGLAAAQVTNAEDMAVLQALKAENDCNNQLNGWVLGEGYGLEADAEGRLSGLRLKNLDLCGVLKIGGLPELLELVVDDCGTGGVALGALPGLRSLQISYMPLLNTKALGLMPNLEYVRLDSAGVRDLAPLAAVTALKQADLSYNRIADVSALRGHINLETLNLMHNDIGNIRPLAALGGLKHLNLATNRLDDVSALKALKELQVLELSDNKISDISALQSLAKLHTLNLAENLISDVDVLKDLPLLVKLDVRHNLIRDIAPLKNAFGGFENLLLEGNAIPLHQMYDEATEHRWAAAQQNVYFGLRVQYLPVLDYWVIPHEDLAFGETSSKIRIEGPKDGARYDEELGRVVFSLPGSYRVSISNAALFNAEAHQKAPVTKSGAIVVLDTLPDELELYTGREGMISPAVVNTLYMLLQTHGVVEALDYKDPYYDAMWILNNEIKPPRMYWQQ